VSASGEAVPFNTCTEIPSVTSFTSSLGAGLFLIFFALTVGEGAGLGDGDAGSCDPRVSLWATGGGSSSLFPPMASTAIVTAVIATAATSNHGTSQPATER
jgi:hypothetical protein